MWGGYLFAICGQVCVSLKSCVLWFAVIILETRVQFYLKGCIKCFLPHTQIFLPSSRADTDRQRQQGEFLCTATWGHCCSQHQLCVCSCFKEGGLTKLLLLWLCFSHFCPFCFVPLPHHLILVTNCHPISGAE